MRKTSILDLKLELWLRQRNSGSIYWTTKDGRDISIKDMDNNHLVNTIRMIERDKEMEDHAFEMNPMDYYD